MNIEKMRDEIIQVLLATSCQSEGMTADAILQAVTHHQAESEAAAEVFERAGDSGSYEEVVFHSDCPPGTKLYKRPQPTAQVPEKMTIERAREFVTDNSQEDGDIRFMSGWNMCRDAMFTALTPTMPSTSSEWSQGAQVPAPVKEVVDFLLGKAPLDGIWYGDGTFSPEVINEKRGAFWWRRKLRNAMLEVSQSVPATQVPEPWRGAAQEFVDRCDRGEIRSKRTYARFKELLSAADGAPSGDERGVQ